MASGREIGSADYKELARLRAELVHFASYTLSRLWSLAGRLDPEDLAHEVMERQLDQVLSNDFGSDYSRVAAYLKRCIHNAAIDQLRKSGRETTMNEVEESTSHARAKTDRSGWGLETAEDMLLRGEEARESIKAAESFLRGLRAALTEIRWEKRSKNSVDMYAVLLFELRRVMAARAGHVWHEEGLIVHRTLERVVPWTEEEKLLSFHAGLPGIDEIWKACGPMVDEPPHRIEAFELSRRVGGIMDADPPFTIDAWYQWLRRAKTRAKERAGEKLWREVFALLLPEKGESKR